MRRCKYYSSEAFCYEDYSTGDKKIAIGCHCYFPYTPEARCEFMNCLVGINCNNHTPVELDPYWKDIVDETNRRLNNEK